MSQNPTVYNCDTIEEDVVGEDELEEMCKFDWRYRCQDKSALQESMAEIPSNTYRAILRAESFERAARLYKGSRQRQVYEKNEDRRKGNTTQPRYKCHPDYKRVGPRKQLVKSRGFNA